MIGTAKELGRVWQSMVQDMHLHNQSLTPCKMKPFAKVEGANRLQTIGKEKIVVVVGLGWVDNVTNHIWQSLLSYICM